MLGSRQIRSAFMDYFRARGHTIRPSGSVIPASAELSFVNAGMNQFAGIIQGTDPVPSVPRIANSQKCIRLGGKHSDLNHVGYDGTHHTFFEMLGSWSFNDYFKEDAIQYAWEFLTKTLEIPEERLNVTYFKDDLETRELWLSKGLSQDKVKPMGASDNFWEMGSTGPCGPCTEIHYKNTELWNLVFMEHMRTLSGDLISLDKKTVDTGMGLERLVSVLNGKDSNYDTDLFSPLFKKIHQLSGVKPYSGSFRDPLDISYRILADHSRMIAACFSDELLPDVSYRLRNIIRRSINIISESFQSKNEVAFLKELIYCVSETLGVHHREFLDSSFIKDESKLKLILDFEFEVLKEMKKTQKSSISKLREIAPSQALLNDNESQIDPSMIGKFYDAFKNFSSVTPSESGYKKITGKFAFKLYDSLGFRNEDIELFARLSNAEYDPYEFQIYNKKIKEQSKSTTSGHRTSLENLLKVTKAPATDDTLKYKWIKSGIKYQFYIIESKVSQLLQVSEEDAVSVDELKRGDAGIIIVDRTPFYSESGGQASDTGSIVGSDIVRGENVFHVHDVFSKNGVVYHVGTVSSGSFKAKDMVKLKIDPLKRVLHMQNHTGSHILNTAMNTIFPLATQRSLKIDSTGFKFDACIFKINLSSDEINQIEEMANQIINNNEPVTHARDKYLDSFIKNSQLNVITLPGEKYPEKVSMICLSNFAEPCCGTHVNFTSDVEALTVTQIKSVSSGIKSFKCLTGKSAIDARENGIALLDNISFIRSRIEESGKHTTKDEKNQLLQDIAALKKDSFSIPIPYVVRTDAEIILNELKNYLERGDSQRMHSEVDRVVEDTTHLAFIVHNFGDFEYMYEGRRLVNFMNKKVKDKVVFCSVSNGNSFRLCALVPKMCRKADFNALTILRHVEDSIPPGVRTRNNKRKSEGSASILINLPENDPDIINDLLTSVTELIKTNT